MTRKTRKPRPYPRRKSLLVRVEEMLVTGHATTHRAPWKV